jgi:predicted glycosyltransferase
LRVLIDICHPAHVYFFRDAMKQLIARGHELMVTSRAKEIALELLDSMTIRHRVLSTQQTGALGLGRELIQRDMKLYREVKRFRPDIMAAIGGIFIAHAGKAAGVPSLVFYDTENARLQNALTYPLASRVIVPRCYDAWTPKGKTIRYAGYHELAYLRPENFKADRTLALANGLDPERDNYLIRLVSWKASHDIGESGWNAALLRSVVDALSGHGAVLISSEAALPDEFEHHRYTGKPHELHHLMAFCRGFVGESATMASECAVLGVPAIYAATTGRGYTDEQERRYGLVRNVRELSPQALRPALEWLLAYSAAAAASARDDLLNDTIDVTGFISSCIEGYPDDLPASVTQEL